MPVQAGDIKVDGVVFAAQFQDFDSPLQVQTSLGSSIEFIPWYFLDYLSALGRCMYPDANGLKLDSGRLTSEALLHSGVPEDLYHELGPIALWWAVGGEYEPLEIKADEVVSGEYKFQLRSWTAKERMDALAHCLNEQSSDGMEFDFIHYVELMVRASVVKIKPSIKLETLNAARTSELLEVVTRLNVVDSLTDEIATWASVPGLQHMLNSTLQLCKLLGWGPSQIWSLPAADIDRLIAMLELQETRQTKSVSHSSHFRSDPNAVVINIEGDE